MGTVRISATKSSPATTFYLEADRYSQSVAGNYTTLRIYLRAINGPGGSTGSSFSGAGVQIAGVDGVDSNVGQHSANPFLPSGFANGATRWHDGPWYVNVPHNADGTRGAVTLRMSLDYGSIDVDHTASFNDFPTIPRASTPTFTGGASVEPGVSETINTNRASSSFTHTLQYKVGSGAFVTIATGVGTTVGWTPPMSVLNDYPNSATGAGTLRCITYNGATVIGTKDVAFTFTTPSSVVPTWSSVSVSEANSAVATHVGKYVQNVSKLSYAITGAAGVYGSSIAIQRFTGAGQTVTGATGTTPLEISQSGGSVPVSWLIQDTRGKQKTQNSTIDVLPYTQPTINSASVQRALSDGTPDPDEGTYIRVDLNAVVQSLMNTTQRNILQYKIYAKSVTDSSPWGAGNLKATVTPGGVTFNSHYTVAGPYLVDDAYDVRVEVLDRFNTSAYESTIAVAAVFMHWGDGLGVGKYHENGMLDVKGDIYASGYTYDQNRRLALLSETYIGPGNARVYWLDDMGAGLDSNYYAWAGEYQPWGNRVVEMRRTKEETWVIEGHSYRTSGAGMYLGGQTALTLSNGWESYNTVQGATQWSEPGVVRLPSGIVVLSGLITGGTVTSGTTIATLPAGYRPDTDMIVGVLNNSNPRALTIGADGTIKTRGSFSAGFIGLDAIAFPAAGVATWTDVGSGGSSFANSWAGLSTATYGTPAFWKDPYGLVWFRGLLAGGSTTNGTVMVNLPSTHRSNLANMMTSASNDVFGFIQSAPATGLVFLTGSGTNTWLSLGNVTVLTADALAHGTWQAPPLANSWVNYSATYEDFGITRRQDGLGLSKGMIRTGTVGATTRFVTVPRRVFPEMKFLAPRASNAAIGRVDVSGFEGDTAAESGRMFVNFGSNAWFSMDSLKWMVGR